MCHGNDLQIGVRMTQDLHDQLPQDVQKALKTLSRWVKRCRAQDKPLSRATMSVGVKSAYDKIKAAPIPGMPGRTLADACYMKWLELYLVD